MNDEPIRVTLRRVERKRDEPTPSKKSVRVTIYP